MPQTLPGAPQLSAAEREALAVLAEHARERARLDCVWLFAHPPQPESESAVAVELLARACSRADQPLAEAAARAAIARAARGDRRRFDRGRGAEAVGTRVATATRAASAVSAAGQPAEAAGTPDAERALTELAAVALRVVAPAGAVASEPSPADPDRTAPFGAGLGDAMARLEEPPVLAESRARLAEALAGPRGSPGDVVSVVETDVGLALAVLTHANRLPASRRGGVVTVSDAVDALGSDGVAHLAEELPLLRAPGGDAGVAAALVRIGPHAITTRVAADRVAVDTAAAGRDMVRAAAMLHDIGKVVLAAASRGYLDRAVDPRQRPDERVAGEQRRMGIDHAGLGGIALGRLGLPKRLVAAVERHHAADAEGAAAVVRLADLLAHAARGHAVAATELAAAGEALALEEPALRDLVYELARAGGPRTGGLAPSPLTPMQHKVLLGLRRGLTYKQIAADLHVSESTVRSHLHKAYERLGVVDRAQAVLLAQDRGWI